MGELSSVTQEHAAAGKLAKHPAAGIWQPSHKLAKQSATNRWQRKVPASV